MKTGPKRTPLVNKEILQSMYLVEKLSAKEIAVRLGLGETLINTRLHEYGIPVRSRSESLKLAQPKRTLEHCDKISKAHIGKGSFVGSNNPKWKGGITMDNFVIRLDRRYQNFRTRVLRFRGKTCELCGRNLAQVCGLCGHKPDRHVHHIKEFSETPELRYSEGNVIVLCDTCHDEHHKRKKGPITNP